ncbi:MAG: hypothetical protein KC438_08660, partial [Thermomicrobiales bacterium]|nr:hypothetical protein [Thermomicrobiales bacterium]
MDNRRFDSLVKGLAAGASRRTLIKGVLGLGGGVALGGTLLESGTEAAARPTPTPKPVRCPGNQIVVNGQCTCPAGLSACGPDCCNTSVPKGTQPYSECCDNACCFGHCYGEELCCPWPRVFCEVNQECCSGEQNQCCGSEGCCATACCPAADGSALCCEGDTPKCCAGDTCIPESGCCSDEECPGCQTCQGHICVDDNTQCAGCLDCANAQCVTNNANCADGNACTQDICATDGNCSNPFYCSSDSCCDDGNACTHNVCDTGSGVCSYNFDCRLGSGCCNGNPAGPDCNSAGQCFTNCSDIGESCSSRPCCSGDCWDVGAGDICFVCFPDGTPCLALSATIPDACSHCCNE